MRRGREGQRCPMLPTSESTASLLTRIPHGCRSKLAYINFFGAGQVPQSIQEAIDNGEAQLTTSRQGLSIQESHGASLAAQFQCDPLLTSEEQTRLCSLVKDQDKQTLTKGGEGRGSGRNLGVRGGKVNPPGGRGGPPQG